MHCTLIALPTIGGNAPARLETAGMHSWVAALGQVQRDGFVPVGERATACRLGDESADSSLARAKGRNQSEVNEAARSPDGASGCSSHAIGKARARDNLATFEGAPHTRAASYHRLPCGVPSQRGLAQWGNAGCHQVGGNLSRASLTHPTSRTPPIKGRLDSPLDELCGTDASEDHIRYGRGLSQEIRLSHRDSSGDQ